MGGGGGGGGGEGEGENRNFGRGTRKKKEKKEAGVGKKKMGGGRGVEPGVGGPDPPCPPPHFSMFTWVVNHISVRKYKKQFHIMEFFGHIMDTAHLDVQYNVCVLHGQYRLLSIHNDESYTIAACERNVQVEKCRQVRLYSYRGKTSVWASCGQASLKL